MGAVTNPRRSREVHDVDAPEATASPEKLAQLLDRVALVTRPGDGAATLLFALGRISSSSRWLDDGFYVEIAGNDVDSQLEIWSERGSMRERIVGPTTFPVPVSEFIAALENDPTLVGSLRITVEPRKLSFAPRPSGVHERSDHTGDTRTPEPSRSGF
jgi:hypothetical protein